MVTEKLKETYWNQNLANPGLAKSGFEQPGRLLNLLFASFLVAVDVMVCLNSLMKMTQEIQEIVNWLKVETYTRTKLTVKVSTNH